MTDGYSIPADFRQRFCDVYGPIAAEWLATLAARVDDWQARLGLSDLRLVPGLSYNLVFFGRTIAGAPIVLKAAPDPAPLTTEAAALRGFGPERAAAVLESLPAEGLLLTERIAPGERLSNAATEREALEVVVHLLAAGWPEAPAELLAEDLTGFTRSLARAGETPGLLDRELYTTAGVVCSDLLATAAAPRLLHGDLHYDNILVDDVRGHRLIDPKGVVGDPLFDLGYLVSRVMPLGRDALPLAQAVDLRLDVLADAFSVSRSRLAAWGFLAATLSAVWTLEDHGVISTEEQAVARQLRSAMA